MHIDAAGGRLALSGAQGLPLREGSQQALAECLALASEDSAAAAAVAAGGGAGGSAGAVAGGGTAAETRPPSPIGTASRAALLDRLAPQLMRCTAELVDADRHLPSFGNAQAAAAGCRATVVTGPGRDVGGAAGAAGSHWVDIICDAAVRAAATEDGLSAAGGSPGTVLLAQAQVVGPGIPASVPRTSHVQRLQACCLAGLSCEETVSLVAETDAPSTAAEAAALPLPAYSLGAAARVRVMTQLARLYLAAAEAGSAGSLGGSDAVLPVTGGRATTVPGGGGASLHPIIPDAPTGCVVDERRLWELLEGAQQAQRLWGETVCVGGCADMTGGGSQNTKFFGMDVLLVYEMAKY